MAYIRLSGKRGSGRQTIVDQATVDLYGHLKWHLSDTGYALRRSGRETVRLHRLIMQAPEGMVVDHLNGNPLDNRVSNLRVCTQAINTANRKGTRGYAWDKARNKWIVRYRNRFYGRYLTENEAKAAYRRACSGVPYVKTRRKYWNLPNGVSKQFGKYRVRPAYKGTRYWLGQYSTVDEAQKALNKWREERG